VTEFLELSFALGSLDSTAAEEAAFACGASAVTFVDARDEPVLEPAPGELRLWADTRVTCLFAEHADPEGLTRSLGAALAIDPRDIRAERIADREWERVWLKDFHALRFGERLWVCPNHERVSAPDAVVVALDPGLAFGTGTHPSTALCLEYLDAHLARGARVIDYGCGSGVLGIAAARLGAAEVHAFDIDPQALIATTDNALANGVTGTLRVHSAEADLPGQADMVLANILAAPLCELAPRFAELLCPGGTVVLAGLMQHQAADVTAAYAAWFDVVRCGERDDWVCLAGPRR
jgi:ribosomal protein L11 methyltransferase